MSDVRRKLVVGLFCVLAVSTACGQTTTTETLGTVTADQVSKGLGFNLDANQDWQWAAAAAAGATHARIDCTWSLVEQQTAPPRNAAANPQYVETQDCEKGFASAKKYGIHPTVVAAFGAPFHQILTVTVPGGAPTGSTSLNIEFVAGIGGDTLSNIKFPYDYFKAPASVTSSTYDKLTTHGSYEGTFITGVKLIDATHATITLASATIDPIPADNTQYVINEILYPSALTTSPTDPSVVAYGNYVSFLANDMAAHGVTGDIEIWNEPPWLADPWDDRGYLYDQKMWPGAQSPGPSSWISVNYGFIGNLQERTFPQGITATWNGTSGGGTSSLLGPQMLANTGVTLKQPSTFVTSESFHPYGYTPEEDNWISSCLQTVATAATYPANNPYQCLLSGEHNSNFVNASSLDAKAKLSQPLNGIGHSVTETGVLPLVPGLRIPQARFIIRQYLAYEGDGVTPVEFFKLYDATALNDPNFSFVEEAGTTGAYTANPAYTTLQGFMSDIKEISNLPVTPYNAGDLASVSSYNGKYTLTSVHMVGSRTGAKANSEMFAVWQRTTIPCDASLSNCGDAETWLTQASPAAAPVTITIPAGQSITSVLNLTTRLAVPYKINGRVVSFQVADDPIALLIDPTSEKATSNDAVPTVLSLNASGSGSSYGSTITLTAQLTASSGTVQASNGEQVSFYVGSTLLGTGSLASGIARFNTMTIPVGTSEIVAQYAGDTKLTASTGANTVSVTSAAPALSFAPVATQVYGAAPFRVTAASASTGAVTYSVVRGPARLAEDSNPGAIVSINGIGTVTLQAVQAASSKYTSSTAQITFAVSAETPTLTFTPISNVTYGAQKVVSVFAKSASKGAITYSLASGPATISGNTVTITGVGVVTVTGKQVAQGNYSATSSNISFSVLGQAGSLSFVPIPTQTYGVAPLQVSATSSSKGKITYLVVSGPATVSGSLVTITGVGTVALQANQAAAGSTPAATAQTTFTVNRAVPSLSLNPIANQAYKQTQITLAATTTSPGTLSYSVLSGPATISNTALTLTGVGNVSVQVSQAASGNYAAATAQTSFTVTDKTTPTLTLRSIANQTYGASALTLSATSTSPAPITYTVASGPARLKGATLQLTGVGTVIVTATQAATATFNAASARTSFSVTAGALTLETINDKTVGVAPITVHAISASPGAISYAVRGPATITGSTLTIKGTGSVTVEAYQAAAGSYSAGSTNTAFTVR